MTYRDMLNVLDEIGEQYLEEVDIYWDIYRFIRDKHFEYYDDNPESRFVPLEAYINETEEFIAKKRIRFYEKFPNPIIKPKFLDSVCEYKLTNQVPTLPDFIYRNITQNPMLKNHILISVCIYLRDKIKNERKYHA